MNWICYSAYYILGKFEGNKTHCLLTETKKMDVNFVLFTIELECCNLSCL